VGETCEGFVKQSSSWKATVAKDSWSMGSSRVTERVSCSFAKAERQAGTTCQLGSWPR